MTGPKTLIVGDGVVKKVKSICSKNTKVLFSPMKWSDISERILELCWTLNTNWRICSPEVCMDVCRCVCTCMLVERSKGEKDKELMLISSKKEEITFFFHFFMCPSGWNCRVDLSEERGSLHQSVAFWGKYITSAWMRGWVVHHLWFRNMFSKHKAVCCSSSEVD